MADRPRFGPAGTPPAFKELKKPLTELPKFLRDEGLDALEYQAVRWGPKPQMKREDAEKLGENAIENDVWLTMHGSYFINFCGETQTVEASKKRLMACLTAAEWMKAHLVVFHPGFYGKKSQKEALELCVKALREVTDEMEQLGIKNVKLGPETMGKLSQFGSLEEILTLCEQVEQTVPVIDWAHLHAREKGKFKTIDDYEKVLDEIEKRLGNEAVKNLHCHYTRVEFTDKGEKCHHVMDETAYGPDFRPLARLIAEIGLKPVIISESPILDVDSIKMKRILAEEMERLGKSLV
ncbi:deoxyribonuclease IV [Candidatus Bathyarchaeota archaeon]|nr:MAG: deoxyribonuclease IV [Candidatus Bathyarchaeota archaeon]